MNRVELVVSRRGFLGIFSAGAFVVATEGLHADASWQPNVYLGMEPSGIVTIIAHRSEMGTGIRTALPMVAADELDVDFKNVRVDQAIGDTKYGSQDTDGSNSIKSFYEPLRIAGATARTMLERAAAAQWGVPATECKGRNEQVVHLPSGKKLAYGSLVAAASKLPVPKKEELTFKEPAEYRYIGKALPIVDLSDICTGKSVFGIDAKMPGMVYASIERSPVMGGKIVSVDDSEAKKVAGVSGIETIDAMKPPYLFQALGGVAVIANSTWAAMQGRKKLKVDWDLGSNASFDSGAFKKTLSDAARQPGKVARNVGDVDAEFAKGGKIHEAEYYCPLLAHAPMEPPAAVAEFKDGKVIAWTATQNPQAVQSTVASALGIKPADVTACHRDRAVGRGIRAQVEAGLRGGSGGAVEEGRQAGEGGLEPRGRYSFRLFSLRGGDVHEGIGRREGPTDGVAAAQRVSSYRDDVRREGAVRRDGNGDGLERYALRHCESSRGKWAGSGSDSYRMDAVCCEYLSRVRGAIFRG